MFQFFLVVLISISCCLPLIGMENVENNTPRSKVSSSQSSPKALAYEEFNEKLKALAEGNATQAQVKEANLKYERERAKEDEARRERVRRNLFSDRE